MSPIDYLQFVLAPQILNGLTLGVAVVLVALGLTIIFGMLDVINMSHGEFYAVGAYAALALGAAGVGFWFLLVLVPVLMIPLGMAAERLLIRPVFDSKDRHVTTLLVTFGLGLVVEDVLKVIFGANTQRPPTPIPGATEWFGILVPNYRLFLLAVGAVIIGGVAYVVYRTRLGAMVRAAAFDRHMAASLGVPVSLVYAGTSRFRRSARGPRRRAARADLLGLSHHGAGLHLARLQRRHRRRNGLDLGVCVCRAAADAGAGAR